MYLSVCMCTGFPSYIGYISLSSTFPSLVYYGSTKAVAYSDQHVMRYAIGQFVCRILSPPLSRLGFFSFTECKIQIIIEFVFGGIFKGREMKMNNNME